MLKEIRCDAFRTFEGKKREPITFYKGLNVVLGSNSGTNSIGKSTFLMIIDFVFGGDDYIEKCPDVHKALEKPHTIQFMFEFEGKKYHYSRNTGENKFVSICDENYNPIDVISIKKYRDLLREYYGIPYQDLSFRETVSTYFRIYQRENHDEKRPLDVAKKISDENAMVTLLKLFGKYDFIVDIKAAEKESKEKKDIYSKSMKYDLIPKITKKQYAANERAIEELRYELSRLANSSGTERLEILGVKEEYLEEIAELKEKIMISRRKVARLKSEYRAICNNVSDEYVEFDEDIELLSTYFPGVNIRKISEIENFHRQLQDILFAEIEDAKRRINQMVVLETGESERYERELNAIGVSENVTNLLIDRITEIKAELDKLMMANDAHDKVAEYKEQIESYQRQYISVMGDELHLLEENLNQKMKMLNEYIYSDDSEPPHIYFSDDAKNYDFSTSFDTGTGTSCKSLILFDLSVLDLSILPVLIHDSVIHKQIEDHAFGKILELYQKSGKQVFIAMDKQETFGKEIHDMLEKACVLHLSGGGNELFGRAWNKKSNR